MKKTLVLLALIISGCLTTYSQPLKQFSKDSQTFLNELSTMFQAVSSSEQKDLGKALMVDFTDMWLNKFDAQEKDSIYTMCNVMLKRKMKTYPNFEQYLRAAINFHRANLPPESFESWQFCLRNLAKMTNNLRFMALLEGTNLLLTKNYLYESKLSLWKSNSKDFVFKYDSLPYFEFPSLDLTCVKKNDSTCIYGTHGKFFPTMDRWVGKDGMLYWDRVGLPWEEVHAEIHKEYSIQLTKSEFDVDTVTFYNTNFFQRPLTGSLKEKVLADVAEERISYPRFTSFYTDQEIKDIFKDIDFTGGFAMYGNKLIGQGTKEEDAHLFIKKDNKRFVKLSSKEFIMRKNQIGSDKAAVVIYLENDSIFHPGLNMKYNNENRELSLIRDDNGISKSPYFNTYHKIDMYFQALYWKLDQPKMDFTFIRGLGSESNAIFESDNYYNEFRWEKLRGMEEIHPLVELKQIADARGSKTISELDVMTKFRVPKELAQGQLLTYAEKGFIIYNIDDGIVVLKDRIYNYINAKTGKTDYDVIQFNSIISAQDNGTLNLMNYDLKLRGVARIHLSDSQFVYVDPYEQEIVLKKNRDFEFDGRIHAGLFDFYGKKITFKYDMFRFDMPMTDSMSFKVQDRTKPTDLYGHHPLVKVRTVIENLNGEMLIDHPNNKSGLKNFANYPSFISKKDAYVYYDKPFIFNKVYSRDRFYYRLQPFRIDTLDSYNSERKQFNGYLVSAGIFPDIVEPLSVQPDYSLGFVIQTPPGGFKAYGGKGTYDSIVDLSYKGFLGKGTLKYLNSTSRSDDFIFFPDSLYARAKEYTIKEKPTPVEYPSVYAQDVDIKWYPYQDVMNVNQMTKPFEVFANKTLLKGGLSMSSKALTAHGLISFGKVEMSSENYLLKHHSFSSDTTNVQFKTPDLSEMVLRTENFNVAIDFNKQLGKFRSNDENSKITFPFNYYACYMYNFDWLMDKDMLNFHSSKKADYAYLKTKTMLELIDEEFTDSYFVSEHPAQDSLSFYAPDAFYHLTENIIYTQDVPIIHVADAGIFPDSGKVTIDKKAEMLPLHNARLIANTDSKFHYIYNDTINILSKKIYRGNGFYDYVDELGDKQKIYLKRIEVDKTGQTNAFGDISEESGFRLSPFFDFAGKVTMYADKEFLNFDGGSRIRQDCDTSKARWLRFVADIDPEKVAIPITDKPKEYVSGATGNELGMGLYIGDDSTLVYPAFVKPKNNFNDGDVITATGVMTYDKAQQRYYVGPVVDSSAKYIKPENYLYLDKQNCYIFGEGRVNMGANLGRLVLESFGTVRNNIIDNSTYFDVAMNLDFFFEKDAYQMFAQAIINDGGLEPADPSEDKFYNAMRFMVGPKKADDLISQLSLSGKFKSIPDEMKHSLVISDINFTWNHQSRSLVSGSPIGIAMINENQLNKYVEGYIEISRKRSGSILNMYFEVENDWYYFNYAQNKLQSISSNKSYNDLIKKAMSSNKNILKAEDKLPQFAFIISTEKRKNDFLKKIGKSEDQNNE
ncbi:MAG TPA: hypothetical protein PLB59_04695 [Bacteroidales bacterium]|nr:hypothetical protein [Bacteroidales bacterium]HPI30319.1 hypothetical protein [Bacteroidales bacterium]HQN16491.1 hypothetical protein [Bacteroidales bacterium]HQP15243.1 hypothetical protein [Bacteroidales bacterium]